MEFGAHLPLMDFGGHPYTLGHLTAYTTTAAQLGFRALSVNDHMVFAVPWLDGPTAGGGDGALGGDDAGDDGLARSRCADRCRSPRPWPRSIVCRGVGCWRQWVRVRRRTTTPRSVSNFSERWQRFDEAIGVLRALWRTEGPLVRRPVLLDRGPLVGARPSSTTERSPDLDWQLGLRGWAAASGPSRRRLAGVGLQHDPGAVRSRVAGAALEAGRPREGSRDVPECIGDDVVLHHRRPRRGRPDDEGTGRLPPCTGRRTCSVNVSRSALPNCSPRS